MERTLLTAIATGASPPALAESIFAAETDRVFADGGHSLDFINKAFECLDLIGWNYASTILPTVAGQMVVRAQPVSFCFSFNWTEEEAGVPERMEAFRAATAGILGRIAEMLA